MVRISVSGPWITQKEIDYVTDAVTNAWYSNANMYHARFEKAFAEYIGARHAMSLSFMHIGDSPGANGAGRRVWR